MSITPLEAANQTGKSKTAILKAIKSGRISANKNGNGQWQIDPAELFRVYPAVSTEGRTDSTEEHGGLRMENELLRQRCAMLESQFADMKEDRNHWRQQATALLTYGPAREILTEARRGSFGQSVGNSDRKELEASQGASTG